MKSSENKIGEIYSRNLNSPVMLRVAEKEISEKNYSAAIQILEEASSRIPDNASICFLLGKAYAASGKYKSALEQYRKGSDIIGSDKTYEFYLRQVEQQKKEQEEIVYVPAQFSGTINESIPGATQPAVSETGGFESYENLNSETLAKIYLTQGEKEEALKVYEKLIIKHPLKKLYYEAKILDIQSGIK